MATPNFIELATLDGTELVNTLHTLAHERVCAQLEQWNVSNVVQIWPDESRAIYEGSESDVKKISHIGGLVIRDDDPRSAVESYLYSEYTDAYETLKDELEEKSQHSVILSGSYGGDYTTALTFRRVDGWYGCLEGVYQGNSFSGDDLGPFDDREEAEEALKAAEEAA